MTDFASLPPAERFALIIQGMGKVVGSCGGRAGLGEAFPTPRLPAPLVRLIWDYLRRLIARFTRYAASPPPPPRPARKRRPATTAREPKPLSLPRGKAWLLRLIQQTACGASQLRHFLAQPDTVALLDGDPRLYRALRPLCFALGIPLDHILTLARKSPPPAPAPPAAATPPAPAPRVWPPPPVPLPILPPYPFQPPPPRAAS